ncbi:VPLPA-CTERM sorting domain-containing protein [Rubrimonas cliftonensis]|uniref:VPLPA-CTERM protein sorting domain-containing protein n=1 Tax=Rubrimonas cliftonensis TaxID=89524 RepID=A0A1H4CUF1_9RHOB|nr:VPLPA-CTERM sorting domain-containing protein [Rubrimonas cliftonensis]SEA63958.1 VPLPA-CTERM protein sorting domain-containing protein [Rubrimonas cliftonensis]
MIKSAILGSAIALTFGVVANAASTATIDFTDRTVWPDGFATTSVFGSTVSLQPEARINSVQDYDGFAGETGGLAEVTDGFGIRDDELTAPSTPPEFITVNFDGPLFVTGFHFLDLYQSPTTDDLESAIVTFDDGGVIELFAVQDNEGAAGNGGYAFHAIDRRLVSSLTFTVGAGNDGFGKSDYAVAGIDVEPVPLPAAAWMLLTGLAGAGYIVRRRRAIA